MMEKIRTAANSIIVKAIFGIIILAFIFTGVGGFLGMGSSANDEQQYIAKVDGEGISRNAFERKAQVMATQYSQVLGGDSNAFTQLIRSNLLNQIINDNLIYLLANKLNITISDDLVKKTIRMQTVFLKNGKFDNQQYLELLQSNGYSPQVYAEVIRTDLEKSQLINALFQSDFSLPVDLDIATLYEQERTVYLATIPQNMVPLPENLFSIEKLEDYYKEHQDIFNYSNEKFKLESISVSRALIESKVTVSDGDVSAYYDENKDNYIEPASYSYSVIELSNRNEANEVYQLLKQGVSFVELVQTRLTQSELGNATGNLGWFKEYNIPDELMRAKLETKGSFSSPISLDNGNYMIVNLNDIRPSKQVPLEVVFNKVKVELIQDVVDKKFNEEEKYLSSLIKDGLSLKEIEEKLSERLGVAIVLRKSDWIDEQLPPLHYPEIQKEIEELNLMGENGNLIDAIAGPVIVDNGNLFYAFKVTQHRDAGQQLLEQVKEDIVDALTNQYINENYAKASNELVNGFNTNGFDHTKGIFFANRQTIKHNSEGVDKAILDTAFSLVQRLDGKDVYGLAKLNNSNVIVAITNVMTPESASQDISEELLETLLNSVGSSFSQDLRSKAKIEIMPNANL